MKRIAPKTGITIAGIAVCVVAVIVFALSFKTVTWKPVTGTTTSSFKHRYDKYTHNVEYVVDGKTYTTSTENTSSAIGTPVSLIYNPNNPSDTAPPTATLRVVAGFLLFIGLLLAVGGKLVKDE